MSEYQLIGSAPPYVKSDASVRAIMYHALAAFAPAGLAGIYFFGLPALLVILVSVVSAVATEAAIQKLRGLPVTVSDGSAAITGLLLAYTLPPGFPLVLAALGAIFAIAIVKQTFGGLGHNIFNPALAARVFLMVSWPKEAATFLWPQSYVGWAAQAAGGFDAASTATPLSLAKEGALAGSIPVYWDLFIGRVAGSLGETSVLAVLVGAVYLFITQRDRVSWRIPVSYVGTVALLTWVFGGKAGLLTGDPVFALFSGGLMLGAAFYATDIVTSPITARGKLIMGLGCGILTFVIRVYGKYPEGVVFSILIMNALVPMIDRFTLPKRNGEVGVE